MRRLTALALFAAIPAASVLATAAPAHAVCVVPYPAYQYVGCNPVCSALGKVHPSLGNCID